jgi:hypothetical protein
MQRGRALLGLPRGQPYARPTNPAHLSKKDTSRYGWTCCFSSIFTVIYVQLCGTSVSYPRVHAHMHSFCISFIQVCSILFCVPCFVLEGYSSYTTRLHLRFLIVSVQGFFVFRNVQRFLSLGAYRDLAFSPFFVRSSGFATRDYTFSLSG